ncbi:Aste57867_15247 [Aphanomyces stellatus]|uniref:Aste57867_15247 protein n=1 Tax=Aphanomyces stellatus TaxID=120398 RepID=A0A485L2P9_9STRA|nr:hypothetical protein As57867_015191 [Aphanomyces stellatus]VFT92056.1 Aste57867_15247 [Aphanomyces stellatus]
MTATAAATITPELVALVASYVYESADLFAFLDAFQTIDFLVDALHHLWQLSQTSGTEWHALSPVLQVDALPPHYPVGVILPLYLRVQITDWTSSDYIPVLDAFPTIQFHLKSHSTYPCH